jgi:Leucine-rich repeat (LRR) protein
MSREKFKVWIDPQNRHAIKAHLLAWSEGEDIQMNLFNQGEEVCDLLTSEAPFSSIGDEIKFSTHSELNLKLGQSGALEINKIDSTWELIQNGEALVVLSNKHSRFSGFTSAPALFSLGAASLTGLDSFFSGFFIRCIAGEFSNLLGLEQLSKPPLLDFVNCNHLLDLSALSKLNELKVLGLRCCKSLTELSPLENLINLEALSLESGESLSDLTPLKNMKNLKCLDLSNCKNLTDISPLQNLSNLRSLSLTLGHRESYFSNVSQLIELTVVDSMNSYQSLLDLTHLRNMKNLEYLDLGNCPLLCDISPLANLKTLTQLTLRNCKSLKDLSPISGLTSLRRLYISACPSIEHIPSFLERPGLDFNIT